MKDGPKGQAGERDRPCSDGLLSAGENLQCILRRAGREVLLAGPTLPGTLDSSKHCNECEKQTFTLTSLIYNLANKQTIWYID